MRKFRILFFEVIGLGVLIGWLMWKYPQLVDDIIPWVALLVVWHFTWELILDTKPVRRMALAFGRRINKMWILPLVFAIGGCVSLLYWVGINNALGRLAKIAAHQTSPEEKPGGSQHTDASGAVGPRLGQSTSAVGGVTPPPSEEQPSASELHLPQIQISRDIMPLSVTIAAGARADILTFGQDRSIHFQQFTNDKDKIYIWPPRAPNARPNPDFLHRYQLINQSKSIVYNLQLPFKIEFGQAGKGWTVNFAKDLPLEVGLLAPGVPYVFYAVNQSPEHVMIMEPATIRGQLEGESYLRDIPLGRLIRNASDFVPLNLTPTHNSWEGNRLTSNVRRHPKPPGKK